MSKELSEFITAVGALAEALRMFRVALLKNGFSQSEAMRLTEVYLREALSNSNKNKEEN